MSDFDEMCSGLFRSYAFKTKATDVKISRASVLRQISGKRPTDCARTRFVDCVLELAEIAARQKRTFIDLDWLAPGTEYTLQDHGFRLQRLANEMIRVSW